MLSLRWKKQKATVENVFLLHIYHVLNQGAIWIPWPLAEIHVFSWKLECHLRLILITKRILREDKEEDSILIAYLRDLNFYWNLLHGQVILSAQISTLNQQKHQILVTFFLCKCCCSFWQCKEVVIFYWPLINEKSRWNIEHYENNNNNNNNSGFSHDIGKSIFICWENAPRREVQNACLSLDAPTVSQFIDTLWATMDCGGRASWILAWIIQMLNFT